MVELKLHRGFGVGPCDGLDRDLDEGLFLVMIKSLLDSVNSISPFLIWRVGVDGHEHSLLQALFLPIT